MASLSLPGHLSTLLSLHSAVEHALIVHLATSGGNAVDSSISPTSTIQLPSVITYTTLRPIVERSCGRRLGTAELARLMWLWGCSTSSASDESASSAGSNIGFHITKGKTMDRAGNRSYDYFFSLQVGLDLDGVDCDGENMAGEEDELEGSTSRRDRQRKRIASGEIIPTTPPRKKVRPLDLPDEPQTPSPSPRSINVFGSRQQQSNRSLFATPSSPSTSRLCSSQMSSPTKHQRGRSISANQLLLSSSPTSSAVTLSTSKPGSLALVAMWNSGIEGRKRVVRKRLLRWTMNYYETWLQEQGKETQGHLSNYRQVSPVKTEFTERPCTPPPSSRRAVEGPGGILTPSATREDDWVPGQKRVVDLFANGKAEEEEKKAKPSSRGIAIQEWDADFPLNKVPPIPQASLPEAPAPVSSSTRAALQPASRRDLTSKAAAASSSATTIPKPETSSSISGQKMSLAERIKAKEEAKRSQMAARAAGSGRTGLGLLDSEGADLLLSSTDDDNDLHTSRSRMMAKLKRKSALSRLQDVAESLYMLFSSKATTTTTTTTATYPPSNLEDDQEMMTATTKQTRRYPYLPVNDVTKSICTSSKVAMSDMEAREAFKMLQEIAPGFLEINRIGAKEWIRMGQLLEGSSSGGGGGGLLTAVRMKIRAEVERS